MPASALRDGLAALGLELDDEAQRTLLRYGDLLRRWNRVFNLTAVDAPREIVTRHLLDALAVLPYLPPGRIVDVGSGAGLPGIPFAVARPELDVTLLDASAKRVRFMRQAVIELGLANAHPVHARAENHRPDRAYDAVVTRAFAGISDMLSACRHLVGADGVILAMKGQRPDPELAALPTDVVLRDVVPLAVPGLDAARHLVRLVPVTARRTPR
ncbi:MAG: 16S rRNA (guanine(527)-N(7))-methyltransferase RsmG [Gammaproteobacteria bacterium]|nr:16S rRNA (guanine(527)-N(7))-methyltransferase RsmG [Gammaproteobacteria bacterium]